MKIHWRTEDRWLREFWAGSSILMIAIGYSEAVDPEMRPALTIKIVEDAIRRAILRRERRRKK